MWHLWGMCVSVGAGGFTEVFTVRLRCQNGRGSAREARVGHAGGPPPNAAVVQDLVRRDEVVGVRQAPQRRSPGQSTVRATKPDTQERFSWKKNCTGRLSTMKRSSEGHGNGLGNAAGRVSAPAEARLGAWGQWGQGKCAGVFPQAPILICCCLCAQTRE